jgi:hypothetical protein
MLEAGEGFVEGGGAIQVDELEGEGEVLEVDVGIYQAGSEGTAVQIKPFAPVA